MFDKRIKATHIDTPQWHTHELQRSRVTLHGAGCTVVASEVTAGVPV